jgi:hypothetical protein
MAELTAAKTIADVCCAPSSWQHAASRVPRPTAVGTRRAVAVTRLSGELRIVWRECKTRLHKVLDVRADKRPRMFACGRDIGRVVCG